MARGRSAFHETFLLESVDCGGGSWTAGGVAGTTSSASASVIGSAYYYAVMADNPLAYYGMDETSGTTAVDSSGTRQ